MKIELSVLSASKINADAIILGIFESDGKTKHISPIVDASVEKFLSEIIPLDDFRGKQNEISVIYSRGVLPSPRVIIVGLGKKKESSLFGLRSAAATAFKKARDLGCKTLCTTNFGSDSGKWNLKDNAQVIIEGGMLGLYRWRTNQTIPTERGDIEKLIFLVSGKEEVKDVEAGLLSGETISLGVYLARNLVNQAPNNLTPEELGKAAQKMADENGVNCIIHDLDWIKAERMNAFLAVGQGSIKQPKFIELEYKGSTGAPLIMIGKGLTFDSGGISLKPADGMEDMRTDMGGAAAVIGAISAISKMKLPVHIVGLIAACENLPGGTAYRPADVIHSRNGKTIEIISTDAEGRLTLADALDYAKIYKPRAVIDLATLTGACVVALGENVAAGYFTNDENLANMIEAASKTSDEKLWRLPLYKEYREKIKTDYADIKNSGGRNSGVGSSAIFLEDFSDFPWAHWDIAGMVLDKTGPVPIYPLTHPPFNIRGATGFGVRSIVSFVKEWLK